MNHTAPPRIRPATRADAAHLVAWNAALAEETEDKSLRRSTLKAGVAGVFDDPALGFYLIAEVDGKPAGGLLITYEWSDWRDGRFWWIQSVYVVPEARRRGIFRAMHAEAGRRARAAGAVGLRLYVELENTRAQQTYESLGMQRCRYHMYETGFSEDP